ncbi:MAG: hypothetical protein ABIP94_17040 [Planctomycetota bacterium]
MQTLKIPMPWLAAVLSVLAPGLAQDSSEQAPEAGSPTGVIAFNRSGKILVLSLETGVETVLVENNVYDRPLTWLPASDRLVYWNHDGGAWDLWSVDAGSKQRVALTKSASDSRSAVGSPDGKVIAFMRGDMGVWSMDASGANQVQLDARGHRDAPPAWSPSGARLAFTDLTSTGDTTVSLASFVVQLEAGKAKSATELGHGEVAFFLDETHVLLEASHEGARELVVVDVESGVRRALTKSVDVDSRAVLSPDRSRIAWVERSKQNATLKIMRVDGSEVRALAPIHHLFSRPSFSPDGRFLAYDSGPDRVSLQAFIVPTTGGSARAVTKDGGSCPVWRPH